MQEKLQREEEELKREKQRLMEERETQRLQRYISQSPAPAYSGSDRPPLSDANKYAPSTSSTVTPEDRGTGKLAGNEKTTDRQQQSYAGGKGESMVPGQVPHEKQRFGVDNGAGAFPPDLAAPRPSAGQYQQQQDSKQSRHNPVTATAYQRPNPSTNLPTFSVPAANSAARHSDQPQQMGSKPLREDLDDRNRQISMSLDRNDQFSPRLTSVEPRIASQPRGYPEHQAGTGREAVHDQNRSQGHWRQPSYEVGYGRNTARDYNRPEPTSGGRTSNLPPKTVDPYRSAPSVRDERGSYRGSTSSSQPDLSRYTDHPASDRLQTSRPAAEPVQRPAESYHPTAPYQAYPSQPAHARSSSNPVVLRAQGSNASSSAVDSLFAYHQTTSPTPETSSQRPGTQSSQYVPPSAAVHHISMQAQSHGVAPAKPPRLLASSASTAAAAYPYDYGRRDSDSQGHAEYAQQVSTNNRVSRIRKQPISLYYRT